MQAPLFTSTLLPAKAHLGAAAVAKYRQLLRQLNGGEAAAAVDSSTAVLRGAKARALARLHERRARLDPLRAMSRLRDRLFLAAQPHPPASPDAAAAACEGTQRTEPTAEYDAMTSSPPLLRAAVLAAAGGAARAFMAGAARTEVSGAERLAAALDRPPGRGLITVSNHVASIDDPLVTAALLPAGTLLRPAALRWTLCATDRCFRHAAIAPFFRAGKVLPVERGKGMNQPGMRAAAARLAAGDWVHVFPEGTRGGGDGGSRMLPARRGVGWLAATAAAAPAAPPPLILPWVHSGMGEVVPRGAAVPRVGQTVRILVGEPVEIGDLVAAAAAQGWRPRDLHAAIADRVGAALYELKARLDGVAVVDVAPLRSAAERALEEEALLPPAAPGAAGWRRRWRDRWDSLGVQNLVQRARREAEAALERRGERAAAPPLGWDLVRGLAAAQPRGGGEAHQSVKDFVTVMAEQSRARAHHLRALLTAAATRSAEALPAPVARA